MLILGHSSSQGSCEIVGFMPLSQNTELHSMVNQKCTISDRSIFFFSPPEAKIYGSAIFCSKRIKGRNFVLASANCAK